jgi:hypothetical protein
VGETEAAEASTSMPVVKEEKRRLSFSPHPHHRRGELEAHAASAIQQPVVKHEQGRKPEVMGASGVLPPPLSSKVTSPPPKQSGSPFKGWFFGSMKGFFGPPTTVYIVILTHAAA